VGFEPVNIPSKYGPEVSLHYGAASELATSVISSTTCRCVSN